MPSQNPVIHAATQAAVDAVVDTAASNTNNIPSKSVDDAKLEMRANIQAAIEASPVIQNLTSTETHFYLRRSFWSQVGSGLGALAAIAVPAVQYLQTHTTDTGTTSISVLGLAMCIWSNYASYRSRNATTPLGAPAQPANPVPYRG